ncbi:MAG: hypothetical protein M3Y86_09440 [Verrucomicrobiota bacterium]|nr:hypothetical protein [Verrucomicrobiota bacterium]
MKPPSSQAHLRTRALAPFAICLAFAATAIAQPPPPGQVIAPAEVVEFSKLLPILPEPPAGWKAEEPEGSTEDLGETQITNVHRDYSKGEGKDAPTTAISILDSAANPEYVESTTAAWNSNTSNADGYTKSINIDGVPGFETFENDGKHGTLWLMVAKRYFLQIETTGQDAPQLQDWLKRIDLKKLAAIK